MAEYHPLDQGSKMEDTEKQNSSPIPIKSRKKGGLITMPFIIGNLHFWGFLKKNY